jgi:peptide/nickel transport system permease protein
VVTRSATMQVRSLDYIAAARAIGCSTARIILVEILPNIANVLLVVATLEMAQAILLEATLSFLGLGIPPPAPSWGLMVAEGKEYMFFSPWVITIPGAAPRAPRSASKRDPFVLRFERLALAPSELVRVAETGRVRVGV